MAVGTPTLITMLDVTALVAVTLSIGLQVQLAEVLAVTRVGPEGNLHIDDPAIVRTLQFVAMEPGRVAVGL